VTNKITLERSYKASLDDVWDLWTTKEGIESWWGPDGFRVEVRSLDLSVGGKLAYAMIAAGAEQIEFMKKAGMPTVTETSIVYTEVTPKTRLAYDNLVDFVPGMKTYSVSTTLELRAEGDNVNLRLLLDPMHSEEWTGRMKAGWESELGKLEKVLRK